VLDALGPALDVLVVAFALLTEGGEISPRGARLEAFLVLPDLHAVAANLQGALRQHHVALEYGELLGIVHRDAVGFEVDGLFPVGLLGTPRRDAQQQRASRDPGKDRTQAHALTACHSWAPCSGHRFPARGKRASARAFRCSILSQRRRPRWPRR